MAISKAECFSASKTLINILVLRELTERRAQAPGFSRGEEVNEIEHNLHRR
jgi:hypothetical protein